MIYGYLRVSSDEQDINSQKQGVDQFASDRGWVIGEYITDEGISGGKDPNKRNLGPLLKKIHKGDIIIASEISRLGRDLYMVMDILHFCMKTECKIYTVKDKFELGDDIQSKVLAFAFGLSAEIERQMIQQRTREGLRLRVKLGVLTGRPFSDKLVVKEEFEKNKGVIIQQFQWGVPIRRIAANFNCDRATISRLLCAWKIPGVDAKWLENEKEKRRQEVKRAREASYKDDKFKIVELDRDIMKVAIEQNMTVPEIHIAHFDNYSYEQVYDTILCDPEFNSLYRRHGQLKLVKRK